MTLTEAINQFIKLPMEEAAKKHIYREWGCCPWIKPTIKESDVVIYDLENDERFFKHDLQGVYLRLDEIIADDWFIRNDDWEPESKKDGNELP